MHLHIASWLLAIIFVATLAMVIAVSINLAGRHRRRPATFASSEPQPRPADEPKQEEYHLELEDVRDENDPPSAL